MLVADGNAAGGRSEVQQSGVECRGRRGGDEVVGMGRPVGYVGVRIVVGPFRFPVLGVRRPGARTTFTSAILERCAHVGQALEEVEPWALSEGWEFRAKNFVILFKRL